jgi:hypothetical protein
MTETSTTSSIASNPTNIQQNTGQYTADNVSPIYAFSSGLVQISGISTLFGGTAVEEQAVGFRGAAGFAWAPVSCFGVLKIVRVCVAGAVSDSWRDIIGLRNTVIDDAFGFTLWTDATKPPKPASFMEKKLGLRMDFPDGNEKRPVSHCTWLTNMLSFPQTLTKSQKTQPTAFNVTIADTVCLGGTQASLPIDN